MTGRRSTAPGAPVELDAATGRLRVGTAARRVADPGDRDAVYGAYLSLLYAVRGARRGEELPLRSSDLDALLAIVGDEPEAIEQRLIDLMGCTREEASLLRRVLLRHRALSASVGVAAGLSLLALLGPTSTGSPSSGEPATLSPSPVASSTEIAPEGWLTTDTGEHVPIPEDWNDADEVEPLPAAPAEAEADPEQDQPEPEAVPEPDQPQPAAAPAAASRTPAKAAGPAPAVAPASNPQRPAGPAKTATATAPAGTTDDEVVLGEPMEPIDRPGSWVSEPTGRESEVVLGEPMAPIDRPGSWVSQPTGRESEVVLGEPMAPIDRPGSWVGEPTGRESEVVLGEPMAPIDRPGWSPESDTTQQ